MLVLHFQTLLLLWVNCDTTNTICSLNLQLHPFAVNSQIGIQCDAFLQLQTVNDCTLIYFMSAIIHCKLPKCAFLCMKYFADCSYTKEKKKKKLCQLLVTNDILISVSK